MYYNYSNDEGFYEPIFSVVRRDRNAYHIKKFFTLKDDSFKEIQSIIHEILNNLIEMCVPLPVEDKKMYDTINFKENILFEDLKKQLNKIDIDVVSHIVNFKFKTIGALIRLKTKNKSEEKKEQQDEYIEVYIPCNPSTLVGTPDKYTFVTDKSLIKSYNITIQALKYIKSKNKNILCQPLIKVINNKMVIGILTETNQLIPVIPTVESEIQDDLKSVESNSFDDNNLNYFDIDSTLITSNNVDVKRIELVKRIKLEGNFYNVFRNLVKIVLNKSENSKVRSAIKKLVYSHTLSYFKKLTDLKLILKETLEKYIDWSEYKDLNVLDKIDTCFRFEDDKSCDEKKYCIYSKDDNDIKCKMHISRTNLISDKIDNSEEYYLKISNELIRQEIIRNFILKKDSYLNIKQISYNIGLDEVVIPETILYNNYFDNIIPNIKNKYVKTLHTWSYTNPAEKNKYDDAIKLLYNE